MIKDTDPNFTMPTKEVDLLAPETKQILLKAIALTKELGGLLTFSGAKSVGVVNNEVKHIVPLAAIETLIECFGTYLERLANIDKQLPGVFIKDTFDPMVLQTLLTALHPTFPGQSYQGGFNPNGFNPDAFQPTEIVVDAGVSSEFAKIFSSVLSTFQSAQMLAGMLNNHASANSNMGFRSMSPGWGPGPQFVPPGFKPMNPGQSDTWGQPNAQAPAGRPWRDRNENTEQGFYSNTTSPNNTETRNPDPSNHGGI